MPVTIGVFLSNACHYRRIFVQCRSLSGYILYEPRQTRPLYIFIYRYILGKGDSWYFGHLGGTWAGIILSLAGIS